MSKGYWCKPQFIHTREGGNLVVGPIQINWYNRGLRLHLTWPRIHTFTLIGPA